MKTSPNEARAADHLLRHLHNPQALAKNQLVSDVFEGVSADQYPVVLAHLASVVADAIETLRPKGPASRTSEHRVRQYAILTRYELAGERRELVSKDLNIGMRKFYYERSAALSAFVCKLRTKLLARATALGVVARDFADERRQAYQLSDVGQFDLAVAVLLKLAQSVPKSSNRIRLLFDVVDVLCEAGRTQEARDIFLESRQMLNHKSTDQEDATILSAELALTQAKIASQSGKFQEALSLAEEARVTALSLGLRAESIQLFYADVLGWIGSLQTLFGRLAEAIATYDHAIAILENTSSPTPLLAGLLWQQARCYGLQPGGIAVGRERNGEALDLATRGSNLHIVSQAHVYESQFQFWNGCLKAAMSHGRLAIAIENSIGGAEARAVTQLAYAPMEAAAGHKPAALRRIAQARIGLPETCYSTTVSHIVEGQIRLWLCDHVGALHAAEIGVRRSREAGNVKGLGTSLRLMAEAHESSGNRSAAGDAIRSAVPELERAGDPFSLAVAYECSARLTGNVHHYDNARDIRATFVQSSNFAVAVGEMLVDGPNSPA